MHKIYHTHGIIVSSRNSGEANRMLAIYTRELGLVRASAQGVRLLKSKLRFALQDLSYAKVDLVRGRDIWRVTSASTLESFPLARRDRASIMLLARVGKLIERLCDGEEPNEQIFDDCISAFYYLDTENVDSSGREALELHLVLRIMHTLGYIGESEILERYLGSQFDSSHTESLLAERQSIILHINQALRESHL